MMKRASPSVPTTTDLPAPSTAARPNPARLRHRADKAAALLRSLAHPDRLMLVCHLVDGEKTVGELGELARIGQPTLSQQLGVLRAEGLVATRKTGKYVRYRVRSPEALAVLRTLYAEYCRDAAG